MKIECEAMLDWARVAEGPSRRMDYAIGRFGNDPELLESNPMHDEFIMDGSKLARRIPLYTASIDAVVGMIQRELPGWTWQVRGTGYAELHHPEHRERDHLGYAKTPALALCVAFLQAKAVTKRTPDGCE